MSSSFFSLPSGSLVFSLCVFILRQFVLSEVPLSHIRLITYQLATSMESFFPSSPAKVPKLTLIG